MRARCRWCLVLLGMLVVGATPACRATPAGRPLEGARLAAWEERVERARGLRFDGPVVARRLTPAEVPALLERELIAGMAPGELDVLARSYAALGLLPQDTDLRRILLEFARAGLEGFYSPRLEALFAVERSGPGAGGPASGEPAVWVHELAHALQAAHSNLDEATLGLREHADLAFALGALLEGDALWTAYRDRELEVGTPPPSPERFAREMEQAWSGPGWSHIPRAVREPLVQQYPLGYALAHRLVQSGGREALDAALADPPLSSEQLLHPERYGRAEHRPRFLELPEVDPDGCRPLHRDTLGELGLRLWLAERRGPESLVARPADGWDGDRLAVWDCGGTVAFAWLIRMASPVEAEELAVVAADAVGRPGTGLAAAPRVERIGADVLVSAGLGEGARRHLLAGVRERRFPDLDAFLAAHPEVEQRARRLRALR